MLQLFQEMKESVQSDFRHQVSLLVHPMLQVSLNLHSWGHLCWTVLNLRLFFILKDIHLLFGFIWIWKIHLRSSWIGIKVIFFGIKICSNLGGFESHSFSLDTWVMFMFELRYTRFETSKFKSGSTFEILESDFKKPDISYPTTTYKPYTYRFSPSASSQWPINAIFFLFYLSKMRCMWFYRLSCRCNVVGVGFRCGLCTLWCRCTAEKW